MPSHIHSRRRTPNHPAITSGRMISQPKIVSMLERIFTPPAKRSSGHSSQANHLPDSRTRLIISWVKVIFTFCLPLKMSTVLDSTVGC